MLDLVNHILTNDNPVNSATGGRISAMIRPQTETLPRSSSDSSTPSSRMSRRWDRRRRGRPDPRPTSTRSGSPAWTLPLRRLRSPHEDEDRVRGVRSGRRHDRIELLPSPLDPPRGHRRERRRRGRDLRLRGPLRDRRLDPLTQKRPTPLAHFKGPSWHFLPWLVSYPQKLEIFLFADFQPVTKEAKTDQNGPKLPPETSPGDLSRGQFRGPDRGRLLHLLNPSNSRTWRPQS